MGDEDDIDEFGIDDSKKSERKRQRERQRRSDIANAFEDLSSLLSQIDPDDSESAPNRRRRRKPGDPVESDVDASGMTRLDLIGRTAEVLRKLQRENFELRQKLEEKRHTGGDDKVSCRLKFLLRLFAKPMANFVSHSCCPCFRMYW
jgi:hypothetical protein